MMAVSLLWVRTLVSKPAVVYGRLPVLIGRMYAIRHSPRLRAHDGKSGGGMP